MITPQVKTDVPTRIVDVNDRHREGNDAHLLMLKAAATGGYLATTTDGVLYVKQPGFGNCSS